MDSEAKYVSLLSVAEERKHKSFMERHYMVGYIASAILLIINLVFLCFLVQCNEKLNKGSETVPPVTNDSLVPIIGAVNNTISGAAQYFGKIDINNSPYFKEIDFYHNMPSKTLKILKNFKTYQQTNDKSSGPASAIMAMSYLGVENISEDVLVEQTNTGIDGKPNKEGRYGTTNKDLSEGIKLYGFEVESNSGNTSNPFKDEYGFKEFVIDSIENGEPILVMYVDWGGHWEVIIGYDDMGTPDLMDDVVIIADPYDTSDHRQDGYTIHSMERLYSYLGTKFEYALPDENKWSYIRVSKKKSN